MADPTFRERLQPSLLDRLTDDAPDEKSEALDRRVMTMRQLRKAVLRDLTWLLNTGNLGSSEDLEPYPHVANSVLNYGIPDLTGLAAAGVQVQAIEASIRRAILDFEPRILPDTVRVRAVVSPEEMNRHAMAFEIEGELWGQPASTHLFLKTEIDLETCEVSISEQVPS
jgi:type VI secretion system protein ImpF